MDVFIFLIWINNNITVAILEVGVLTYVTNLNRDLKH